jgi:hypothetical protein
MNAPDAADGIIIEASAATKKAFINRGRNDMLQAGTVFEVREPGKQAVRARARVVKVDANSAEVEVYDVADPVNFIARGDEITNPVYSPNVRRNIALIGRFSHPYSRSTVTTILESLGNKVYDRVEPSVDLVILGNETLNESGDGFVKVEDTPDFKLAQGLGVEFAPLHKISPFLKQ